MSHSRRFLHVEYLLVIVVSGILMQIFCCRASAMLTFGSIEGTVIDKEEGRPLAYCNIVIVARYMGTMTRRDGSYRIDGLPPGAYTVRAMMMGYETGSACRVDVRDGETVVLSFELEPKDLPAEEIIIGPCRPEAACTVHGVEYADLSLAQLPVIDHAIFCDAAYEKARSELFPNGEPFIIDECLSQSTDSVFALRCRECLKQARRWLGR